MFQRAGAVTLMPALARRFLPAVLLFLAPFADVAPAADGEGSVSVTPDFSVAGASGTWTVTYTAGQSGIAAGGSIRIELPTGWSDARWSEPQFRKPSAPHYTTIRASSKTAKLYHHVENQLP